jgi:hypothetical protein
MEYEVPKVVSKFIGQKVREVAPPRLINKIDEFRKQYPQGSDASPIASARLTIDNQPD